EPPVFMSSAGPAAPRAAPTTDPPRSARRADAMAPHATPPEQSEGRRNTFGTARPGRRGPSPATPGGAHFRDSAPRTAGPQPRDARRRAFAAAAFGAEPVGFDIE